MATTMAQQGKLRVDSYRDMFGGLRFRYTDPNTGLYYDSDLAPDQSGGYEDAAREMAREQRAIEETKAKRDREDKREHYAAMVKQASERGDMAEVQYWMGEIERLYERDKYGWDADEQAFRSPPKPVPTVHRDGHFPIPWLLEAIDLAEKSDVAISFGIEREGIMVTAMSAGEQYAIRVTDWAAMSSNDENPLLHAIADVEHKLELLLKIKAKVA